MNNTSVSMKTFKTREAWLEHRKKYIGGSEASSIIGCNPYMNNIELWEIKTGRKIPEDISNNPNVVFGNKAEPILRELFRLAYPQYTVEYEDYNSFYNTNCPWAAASLDGWITEKSSGRQGIWECKTAEIVSSMHKEKWNMEIPQNYYCQLLHYFIVKSDAAFAHLTALLTWNYEDRELYHQIKNYHIERSDVTEDIEYLMESEKEYYKYIESDARPPLVLPNF